MLTEYFSKKHLIIFTILLVLGLIFWLSATFQETFFRALSVIGEYIQVHPVLGILVFFILTVFSAMLVFFSAVALVPISVVVYGQVPTFIILILGWVFGGVISYLIGKYLGQKVVTYFISPKRLLYYEQRITERTNLFYMFLFRLIAPSEIPGYLFGIIQYKFTYYILITFFAELPFAWGAVYATEIFLQQRFLWFIGFLILAVGVIYFLQRRFHHRLRQMPTQDQVQLPKK